VRNLARTLGLALGSAACMLATAGGAFAVSTSVPSGAPSPTPTSPANGLGSTGHGTGFIVLAIILVAALLISTWRLKRDR
jgi:hypothetical protein